MSRLLLLFLVLIWMAGPPNKPPLREAWPDLAVFFSFYLCLVLLLGLWSRMLARRATTGDFHRQVRLFNKVMFGARLLIPIWFTIGVWGLGWGGALFTVLGDGVAKSAAGMLLGTMPAFATWMGLWWSQYPAECALREQNLLVELENDLPLYRPPAFRSYFFSNFRLQVLFTLVPVGMIILVRDAVMWVIFSSMNKPFDTNEYPGIEAGSSAFAAVFVFLFVPALLARVLNTAPMPDCALRLRLDAMCRRAGVSYRHILVWNTDNHVGNAAVMGVLPFLRYVLLSDVLLERMSDRQIEAVFAHELGHVVHRHMTWYAIFFIAFTLTGGVVYAALQPHLAFLNDPTVKGIAGIAGFGALMLAFGAVSRRCERQADVYAARTMQMFESEATTDTNSEALFTPVQLAAVSANPVTEPRTARQTPVGQQGASIFSSALRRVATINNIPIQPSAAPGNGLWSHVTYHADALLDLANNWLHGSIVGRMEYVENLGTDPRLTRQFDHRMFWLFWGLLVALVVSLAFSILLSMP